MDGRFWCKSTQMERVAFWNVPCLSALTPERALRLLPISRGSRNARYLTKRNGFWHFVRRVPLAYAALDKRNIINQTTGVEVRKDRRGIKAGKVADAMNRELAAYWFGLSEGNAQEASDRYNEARRRARVRFDYAETEELATRPTIKGAGAA
jgi:hypothetical protein